MISEELLAELHDGPSVVISSASWHADQAVGRAESTVPHLLEQSSVQRMELALQCPLGLVHLLRCGRGSQFRRPPVRPVRPSHRICCSLCHRAYEGVFFHG
ncbi:hypothetical protein BE17_50625 [Sorangium cellulosum]|uniref:Uncharacterized protein n=1 Tax=Sorangium cellulosum TaxID=56 RepID=A0A150QXD9_SORCE|nr:hypothetical protein BE17_50625 [Sorangium cellulosum]